MNSSDLLWASSRGGGSRDLLDLLAQITSVGRNWVVLDRRLPVVLSTKWRAVGLRQVTATGMQGRVSGAQSKTPDSPAKR
jgi:hypothetical protein